MNPDSGFFIINKPPDITSAALVGKVKRKYSKKKIGHTGTLDKFAEGLMILPFGQYTVFAGYLLGHDKCYEAEVLFGKSTDSGDPEGDVLNEWTSAEVDRFIDLNRDVIVSGVENFIHLKEQEAPKISALKVGGRRQSDLYRAGIEFESKVRKITVYSSKLTEIDNKGFSFAVKVSSGTYIRKLVMDLSLATGLPMHVKKLTRTCIGNITLEDAWDIDSAKPASLEKLIHFLSFDLNDEDYQKVQSGRYIDLPGESEIFLLRFKGEIAALCTIDGKKPELPYKYLKVFSV